MTHASPEELQALVMGIEVADEPALRRHLVACPECSRRLAREAQLELDLHALAASTSSVASRRRSAAGGRTFFIAAAACLVVAMVLAWWRSPRTAARRVAATPAVIAFPDVSRPCLVDPRTLGPGSRVLPPTELCRDVRVPLRLSAPGS